MARPLDIWSSVATILAVTTGLRYGMISTDVPSPIFDVRDAT